VIYLPAEPGSFRYVSRCVISPASIITLGVGGILAVIFGVSLGNSAISQINPLYFQGAALHPRDRGAAVDPNAPTVIPNRYEQLYGFNEGLQARAMDCVGCTFAPPAMPEDRSLVQAASAPYFGSREERVRNDAREQREIDALYQQRIDDAEARRATMEQMRQYTHYRVSEDEVVRERPYYARDDVVIDDSEGSQK
jgi:hypothetical protein